MKIDRAEVEALLATLEQVHKPNNGTLAKLCRLALEVMDAPVGTMAVDAHPWPTIDDTPDWEEGTRVRLVRVGEE